ncbi:hypothetical protein CC86DRAFT_69542 [Ophiobolus disseminans]|uniref:Uncharacterized protein n=1 Tax=Ophiobolus disseminans TaxID=1469910 RepID=A0A6A6ZRY7_9PLEO|nr:hypothetical protein CC86DRAFT_69542 [Ophiobolus disseminans]
MPSLTNKKQTVALSWDAFPEPPPEAKNWKPDPDFIAKPGVLKDPRFNKDPQAVQKKAAMKREMRLLGYEGDFIGDSFSSSSSVSVESTAQTAAHPALSKWPAQVIRSSYPTALASAKAETPTPSRGMSSARMAPFVPARAQITSTTKGTMENFPVMPVENKQVRPLTVANDQPAHIAKTNTPAWAGPLEKLLAEGMAHERTPSAKPASTSTQSNERKSTNSQRESLDLDAQFRAASEASRRISDTTTSNITVNEEVMSNGTALSQKSAQKGAEQEAHVQAKTLLASDDSAKLSAEYQRSMDIALIKYMEAELDISSPGTKSELRSLNDQVFTKYFDRVQTAHK